MQCLNPDIVLLDLFIPGVDGLSIVKNVKPTRPEMQFIMISQVSAKNMIEKAYKNGIEFYIQKPINAVEIETIIKKVSENLETNRTLNQIHKLFSKDTSILDSNCLKSEDEMQTIKNIMLRIGIIGEVGSKDLIDITVFLMKNNEYMDNYTLKELCNKFTDNPKSMEQRIRRTISTGMSNIASLGIEDYMNDVFVEYSTGLFNFEQVKKEMDYIRKKSSDRGKVTIKKFVDGLISYCEK
ncbi:response regulator [Clostridium tagluense]|uniref:response regulator n=1 Tax=Clostridium tagluense TaxID=360422 RepID=UPI001CF25652|nr:response regulator [Clostridium tagluense]MCB2312412.1 response regulator [Clostridium tagluense]MCB2317087.1 response regulator [Clostridium tagluense]MCB2321886.1 response regulator [Clostridium tagluense]MCB2326801.1 response regulator [Clostridium tagluense]MCB2331613.1 response regulator [Clostridium tagluense]